MKVRCLLVHVQHGTDDILLPVFTLRPLHRLTAPIHQPALCYNLGHSLRRRAETDFNTAHLIFPDFTLILVTVLIGLILDSHKPFLDGSGASCLPRLSYELTVMSSQIRPLDVIGNANRAVRRLPLDVGSVVDRRSVAFGIMAYNVVSHIRFVRIYGHVATYVWTSVLSI